QQGMNEGIYRPDTKSTRREQDRRPIGRQTMLHPHLVLVFLNRKHRIDRNPAHGDLLRGYAERQKVRTRFIERHEVTLVMMDQPHRMHVEISDDDHLSTGQTLLRL